jgi:acetyl-CoA carboxylase biotin carboxyl carrier protein
MSDEKRPETPGSQPTGDSSSSTSGGSSSAATRQQPADPRRSSSGVGGATGEVNNSGGVSGGGGRHGSRRRHRGGGERENQTASPRRQQETSINMDELRELADLIAAQGFTEFELEKEGFRLRLSRNTYPQAPPQPTSSGTGSVIPFPAPPTAATTAQPQASTSATGAPATSTAAAPALAAAETPSAVEDLYKITSPIVGTFYRAPSPTSEVFVNQGSRVETETVVCIIEAMKLMNEIQAEVSGTIEKIYVENGQPVEYGQALFGVKKQ